MAFRIRAMGRKIRRDSIYLLVECIYLESVHLDLPTEAFVKGVHFPIERGMTFKNQIKLVFDILEDYSR